MSLNCFGILHSVKTVTYLISVYSAWRGIVILSVCSIPTEGYIFAFEDQFAPTVKNLHGEVRRIDFTPLNLKVLIQFIAIGCKGVWNENRSIFKNPNNTCSAAGTPRLISYFEDYRKLT